MSEILVLVGIQAVGGTNTQGIGLTTLHYTSGNNLDAQGNYTPGQAGFNLADVSSVEELNALPDGVMGLVWLDQYSGVNQSFIDAVTPFIGNPKVYGFFLVDEPDPTGQWGVQASAADLRAESDWIHANLPGAKTFITMMNMGSTDDPSYANTYNWENTHIDLFGLDPYPVRSNGSLDFDVIDAAVAAALDSGISLNQIVPVYQTFGGGGWNTDTGGRYQMPTSAQMQEMFDRWDALVPNAAFDYAYSWGSQNGDVALESSQALQNLFLQHNTSDDTTPDTGGNTPPPVVDDPDTPPVVDTGGSAPPDDVDTGGSTPPVVDAGGGTSPGGGTGGTTPDPAPIDPTPVNHGGGFWHKGHGGDVGGGASPGGGTPIDPTPVNHGGGFWHDGPGFGLGQDNSAGYGLDFSKLLDGGRSSWFVSPQPESGGGWHSWNGSSQAGGDAGVFWHGFGGGREAHATTDANTGPNFEWNWNFAQSSPVEAFGKHHDQQSWHW